MFNNLIKWSSGRTTTKVLATLLVITLTFANFALLGSFMFESIAISLADQDSNTNSENVKFNVYLDANNTNAREVTKDINAEDLTLYASISVQGGGRLENPKIEFSNSNFELKENSNVFEKSLEAISSENELAIELPIIARKNSSYDLSLLNMSSQIKLSGEYIDDNGNVTDINTTKMIKIEWQANEITEEQVELSQEVITNKIYNIDGENKRIVQVLLKSNILQNMAPIKVAKIEVEVPSIGIKPEQISVIAKNTLATNGKTNIQFGDSETSKYEYNEQEGKLYIEVLNNPDTNNIISWQKNVADQFIITYVYSGETNILPFTSKAKSVIELYGREAGAIEKQNEITLEEIQEMGDIASLENSITQNIYKGNMYIGEETNYETKWDTFVSYANLANKIVVQDTGDIIDTDSLSTYYKSTKINKEQAIDILGQEGTIKIYNAADIQTPITEISLSQENQEEDYAINYTEEINSIIIETSKVIKAGKLEITNQKAIKVLNAEKISESTKIDSGVKLIVSDEQNNVTVNLSKTANTNLLEPVTTIEVSTDKTSISNQTEDTLRLTAVLQANNTSNKLFKNPTINIDLPKEITEANIENASLLDDELKIANTNIVTNENGNKVIEITIEGEQTKYVGSAQGGATLVLDLKLKAEQFMADKNVEIKTTCINDGETVELAKNIEIKSKDGLVTKNTIIAGENSTEQINKNTINIEANKGQEITIKSDIINNYGEEAKGVNIIGKVSEGTVLTSQVVASQGSTVYYSEEENPTAESQSWETEITSFDNVKSFKIELPQTVLNGQKTSLQYTTKIKEEANTVANTLTINGTVEENQIQDTINYNVTLPNVESIQKEVNNSLRLSMEVTAGGEDIKDQKEINNGQVVRYKITVTNISDEVVNNANIVATIENGVFYDLVQSGVIMDESVDENGEFIYPNGKPVYVYAEDETLESKQKSISQLNPGESFTLEYQVVAYIGEGENANQFNNNISITADNIQEAKVTDTKTIKEASIALKLKYGSNEEVRTFSGLETDFAVEVTNLLNSDLKNINIKMDLPEELDCDVDDQIFLYGNDNITLTKNGEQITLLFKKLVANETQKITLEFKVNDIPLNELERDITLNLTGTVEGDENTYISNDYTRTVLQGKSHISINLTSDKIGKTLSDGEEITYTANIKNDGYIDIYGVSINEVLAEELEVIEAKVIYANGEEKTINTNNIMDNIVSTTESLDMQESISLIVKAKVNLVDSTKDTVENELTIISGMAETIDSEKLTNKINKNDIDDPEDPTDPENPIDPEKTYSISGLAWLDENKNGIRDNNEKIVTDVNVILLDEQGNIVKDEQGNNIETQTTITGTYKFNNLSKGNYTVVFVYDTEKYTIAKYQVEQATEETNSDAITKQIQVDTETLLAGVTDTIIIDESDIENIDIGLMENSKFDLSLSKYISKVLLSNSSGTTTYEYEDTNFTKVEISARKIAGTMLLVEYQLVVTNEGDVDAYVTDLVDYLPEDLEFKSDTNPEWYMDGNRILHNESIAEESIKPGESKTVTLVLTSNLKSDSTGTIDNIAEIGKSTNLEGLIEYDSVSGNNQTGEDDISTASLIISIATGSPVMYIGIVIASMLVIGIGIYIINKKVLKVEI